MESFDFDQIENPIKKVDFYLTTVIIGLILYDFNDNVMHCIGNTSSFTCKKTVTFEKNERIIAVSGCKGLFQTECITQL